MDFFNKLALGIVNLAKVVWSYMAAFAAAILNNTFGRFTGDMFSNDVAGLILWGGLGGVIVIVLVVWKGFSFEK